MNTLGNLKPSVIVAGKQVHIDPPVLMLTLFDMEKGGGGGMTTP